MGFVNGFLTVLGFGLGLVGAIVVCTFVVAAFQVLAKHLESKKAKKSKDDRGYY